MIKIDLNGEQRDKIANLMCEEINRYIYIEVHRIYKYLCNKKFNNTAELISSKDKVINVCLLKSSSELKQYIQEYENAFEKDKECKKDELVKEVKNKIVKCYSDIYKRFSRRIVAYEILKIMNVNVCPYCNRQYTFTIKKKTRPEFDHFYNKNEYPYLAISIYNLVPSCGLCNKGKSTSSADGLLYPYEESFEDTDKAIYFVITNLILNVFNKEKINVKLESKNDNKNIIDVYNKCFNIEKLYNEHSDYISDILQKKYIFNDDAIKCIYDAYNDIFDSPSKVKQLIFGAYESDSMGQRPLSKLTKDILQQLE